jgi:type II secretory pathway component PulM
MESCAPFSVVRGGKWFRFSCLWVELLAEQFCTARRFSDAWADSAALAAGRGKRECGIEFWRGVNMMIVFRFIVSMEPAEYRLRGIRPRFREIRKSQKTRPIRGRPVIFLRL